MADESTILLNKETISLLKQAKESSRQTYNELLEKMARLFLSVQRSKESSYDQFIHEVQKKKMKELWDNEYDEVWETI